MYPCPCLRSRADVVSDSRLACQNGCTMAEPPGPTENPPPRVISSIPQCPFGRSLPGRPPYLRWSKQRLRGTSARGCKRPEVNSGGKFLSCCLRCDPWIEVSGQTEGGDSRTLVNSNKPIKARPLGGQSPFLCFYFPKGSRARLQRSKD